MIRLDAVVDRLALSYAAIVASRAAIALIVMSGPASSGTSEILWGFDEGRLKNSILGMLRDWVASEVGQGPWSASETLPGIPSLAQR